MTIDQLHQFFKTKTDLELANVLCVSKGMLSRYRSGGIPLSRQALIEIQTKGKLKADREQLREATAS